VPLLFDVRVAMGWLHVTAVVLPAVVVIVLPAGAGAALPVCAGTAAPCAVSGSNVWHTSSSTRCSLTASLAGSPM